LHNPVNVSYSFFPLPLVIQKNHSLVFARPTLMKIVGYPKNPKNVVDRAGEVASSPGLTNNS
jgi:hypothetical protein